MKIVQLWETVKKCYRFLKTRQGVFFSWLLLLTAAVHLTAFALMPVLERDSVAYVTTAAYWAETGKYLQPHFPPLPCFFIKVLIQAGFAPEFAGKCVSFLAGLPVPVLAYLITMKSVGNRKVARYTAFMVIFHPMLIYFSVLPLRDSVYILFISLLILAALDAVKKQSPGAWLLCALWTAAAWTCRYETLEFFLVLPLVTALRVWQKGYSWGKALLHLFIYGICSIVLWAGLTLAVGGKDVFICQYNTYIKNKLILLAKRWKC